VHQTESVSPRQSEVEQILRRLQALCRRRPSDERTVRTGRVPDDLATDDFRTLCLYEDEDDLFRAAQQALSKDLRFEYMKDREAEEALWRFVCQCSLDPSNDQVRPFVAAHARELMHVVCYLPVEHLKIAGETEMLGARLLLCDSDEVPKPNLHFSLEPPVGTVVAVPVEGTSYARMAERARDQAEHVLRVLRVALRAHLGIVDRHLRFGLGEGHAFDDRLSGWQLRPSAAYELGVETSLQELVRESPVAAMPLLPRNQLERKADLALRWLERALLATDPLVKLLYLFFALEALLGDKAQGLKAPVLAYRRAMLGEAVGQGFTHPSVTFFLYEEVRSAAVHGGEAPDVSDEDVSKFESDVRTALNEYLTYGAAQNFTKQSQLVRALDTHPERGQMIDWLRAHGGDIWTAYLDRVDPSPVSELRSLLNATITKARQVANAEGSWDTPLADSQAGKEMAAEEARRPEPSTGSWPWLLAPMIARWGLQGAVEEARGFSSVLAPDGPSNSADVLCRGVLEASSLAWWLLDPEIDAQTRLARSLVYRLNSAEQTQGAIKALGLEPEDNPSEYGELAEAVKQDIATVGLTSERRNGVLFYGQEPLPSYTKRAGSLVAKIWPQEKLPYSVLSAVAHAELLGLQRNLVDSGQSSPGLQIRPGPATGMWLWQDTYLVIGALIFTAERAAVFLGLRDQVAALQAWMQESQRRLVELRPSQE
jgi:hypothetical protein